MAKNIEILDLMNHLWITGQNKSRNTFFYFLPLPFPAVLQAQVKMIFNTVRMMDVFKSFFFQS